jgi:hypothetical protein
MIEFDIICKKCGTKGCIAGIEKTHPLRNSVINKNGGVLFTYGEDEDDEPAFMIRCTKCGALLEDKV